MNIRLSTIQIQALRRLARGALYAKELRELDQRPFRALTLRGLAHLDARLTIWITQDGWEALRSSQLTPRQRKNPNAPTFLEANRKDSVLRMVNRHAHTN